MQEIAGIGETLWPNVYIHIKQGIPLLNLRKMGDSNFDLRGQLHFHWFPLIPISFYSKESGTNGELFMGSPYLLRYKHSLLKNF